MNSGHHKIILKANDFSQIKGIPFVRELIILSFIMNTIRSSQRFLLLTEKYPDGPTKARDTIFGLITGTSFLYEGIKTAAGIFKQVASSLPRELHDDLSWVINEEANHNSLLNTTLEAIRNKITFHFNLQITDDLLKDAIHDYPPVFLEAASKRTVDSAYVFADEVVTQIFSRCDSTNMEPSAKLDLFLVQLSKYQERFCSAVDNVVAQLIAKNAEVIEGMSQTD